MIFSLSWILPLGVSIIYATASLVIKQAMACGAGPTRVMFLSNWLLFFLWLPFFLQNPHFPAGEWAWAPFAGGLARICGGGLLLTALRMGDVSVQTPLTGLKVIFVCLMALFFETEAIGLPHYIAGFLTVVAIIVLSRPAGHVQSRPRLKKAIALSAVSALLLALNDTLAAKAALEIGVTTYLFFNFLTSALGTLTFIPFFSGHLRDLPRKALPWTLGGAFLMALDVLGLLLAISIYQEPTTANILYAARGIWAILLVWILGHWFQNEESKLGKNVMLQRLMGAGLLFGAIITVLLN
jgi:drug/metabolite transporter (DMT)-like permease